MPTSHVESSVKDRQSGSRARILYDFLVRLRLQKCFLKRFNFGLIERLSGVNGMDYGEDK